MATWQSVWVGRAGDEFASAPGIIVLELVNLLRSLAMTKMAGLAMTCFGPGIIVPDLVNLLMGLAMT